MSFVSVERLVRTGHVEPQAASRVEYLWDEIRRLKQEKNAFIPAHNYQVPEIQAIADTVGDSFELAVRARNIDARPGRVLRGQVHGRGLLHPEPEDARSTCPACRRCARWPRWTPTRWPSGRNGCAGWAGSS